MWLQLRERAHIWELILKSFIQNCPCILKGSTYFLSFGKQGTKL